MKHDEAMRRYAHLTIKHGLNIQPGQLVTIDSEVIHRDLVYLMLQECYKAGAKHVDADLQDMRYFRFRLMNSSMEDIAFCQRSFAERYNQIVDEAGADLSIVGEETVYLLSEVPDDRLLVNHATRGKMLQHFDVDGVNNAKIHRCMVAAATGSWGQQVFPKLRKPAACKLLWEHIFKFARVDRPDYLHYHAKHDAFLKKRAAALNATNTRELHFVSPRTDLRVGISTKALFLGGSVLGPRGVWFEPNIPSEEVYTTPDWRTVNGHVAITRPAYVAGAAVEGLVIRFKDGEVVDFTATDGKETFESFLKIDAGARRLGEIALVGIDSPVYQTGALYYESLLDENAACHLALGSSYDLCFNGYQNMSQAEKEALGMNMSFEHEDLMISDNTTNVFAISDKGVRTQVIKNGLWKNGWKG